MRETHAGVVLLLGDHAYKLKKPEDLGFLDYSTPELRLAACQREVDLNRRLSPDVYLGVLDVVDAEGRAVDHLVEMRRMPDSRRLATLVRSGSSVHGELHRLARLLAAFHARALRGPEVSAQGSAAALLGRWADNLAQVYRFRSRVLTEATAETERLALRFVEGRGELFDSRVGQGRVVDGHGDLLAEDVFCLDDGPRVLDCLEFDDDLRRVDGLDDASFLAMDLERLGVPLLGDAFLRSYAAFANDPAPEALHHHYVAYRAFVRAKVACHRYAQGDGDAAFEARLLERIALDHLRSGAVRLVIVGGPPGTGKTTVAGLLADRLGMALIADGGLYGPADGGSVDPLDHAGRLLRMGESVVMDAPWAREAHRRAARRTADASRADIIELRCAAPDDLVMRRLGLRPTDDGPAVTQGAAFQPWPEATTIDTSRTREDALARAAAAADPRPPLPEWIPHHPLMPPD
ncbi:bifunctional aminoglycoside phosphotransferase/ATP-binding protein [Streptomonospora nanhaiensis]|nr:gluconate kinase [Streptomonospora nanhaiensis]